MSNYIDTLIADGMTIDSITPVEVKLENIHTGSIINIVEVVVFRSGGERIFETLVTDQGIIYSRQLIEEHYTTKEGELPESKYTNELPPQAMRLQLVWRACLARLLGNPES